MPSMGPTISNRAKTIPASPIRRLAGFADEAKARGIKVYHLNIGQPDIPTPECGFEPLKNLNRKYLEYSPSQGYPGIRKALSSYYASYGITMAPEEFIITAGGSEALLITYLACLDPGDEIIVTDPSYANYQSFAVSAGVTVRSIPTDIREGFRLPPIEKFEESITERTRAILICNPNNPTGYLYSRDELLRLRDIVLKHNLFLISDEVYREFIYTDEPYVSALSLEGISQNVIVADSVSKRYNECGIRVGAIVTHNAEVRAAALKFAQARLSPPLLGQLVAEASIGVQKEYLLAVQEEYRARRDFLVEGLNKIPGVFAPLPEGAFYVMVELPVDDVDVFCKWCLTDFQYNGATVMMAPGSGFYTNHEDGRHQVRMAYVLKREDLAVALDLLARALAAYPGRL